MKCFTGNETNSVSWLATLSVHSSGASVTDARALARHTDLKTTMQYTHVGLDHQARALSVLRVPKTNNEAGQHIGRTPGHPTSRDESRHDKRRLNETKSGSDGNQDCSETSRSSPRKKAGDGNRGHTSPVKWRQQDANGTFFGGTKGLRRENPSASDSVTSSAKSPPDRLGRCDCRPRWQFKSLTTARRGRDLCWQWSTSASSAMKTIPSE
jgi:hypothetical protein